MSSFCLFNCNVDLSDSFLTVEAFKSSFKKYYQLLTFNPLNVCILRFKIMLTPFMCSSSLTENIEVFPLVAVLSFLFHIILLIRNMCSP